MAKAIVCELCGSNELVKRGDMFVCESCGTKYEPEAAKKLVVEVSGGSVVIDKSDELKNLFVLARRARENGNSDNAQKYYEQILMLDPSSWEAEFYSTYYQCVNCRVGEVGIAAARLTNCEDTVFGLIKDNVDDPTERLMAVTAVTGRIITLATGLFDVFRNHYLEIDSSIRDKYAQEYVDNCGNCRNALYNAGDQLVAFFGTEYGDLAVQCWKAGVEQHNTLMPSLLSKELNAKVIKEYNDKIAALDESYVAPPTNTGGCYVATAVYGSYDCPQVWTLRRYRDCTLAESWHGRAFIRAYYAVSPTLVRWFGGSGWFKALWRGPLDRMVARLQDAGVEATPYDDRVW